MTKPKFVLSKRMVSSRFWTNPELADLERESGIRNLRLTMIGLWAVADEAGIFEWEPRTLAGLIYPYSPDDQMTMGTAMDSFVEAKFLLKIEVDGKSYGVWPNWGEHNDFAHKGQTRYPEVYAVHYGKPPIKTIGRGRKPDTATAVEVPPDTAEPRLEVRKLEVEVLPTYHPNEQQKQAAEVEQDNNPPAEHLAKLLFKLLDQPRDQAQNAGTWEFQVAALLKDKHSEEEIASVMEHAIKDDDFSAEYLTLAKEPMASFVKNYPRLFKGWKALQKGKAAVASRAAKLAKPVVIATAPGAHGNKSGMEL